MSLGRVLQPLGTIGKTAKLYRSVKPSADNVIQLGDKNKNFSKIYTYSVRKANDFEIAFEGEDLVIREPEDNNAVAYVIRDAGAAGAFSHVFYYKGVKKLTIEDKIYANTNLLPESNVKYDIGESNRMWRTLFTNNAYLGRGHEYSNYAKFAVGGGNVVFDWGIWTEFFGNFLLYADLKPGASLTTSGSVIHPENAFRPGDNYVKIDTSGGPCVIELTGVNIPVTSGVASNRAFVQFHGGSGTVDLKIEVQGKSGTWYTVYEGTVNIAVNKLIITDTLTSKGVSYPDEWPAKGIRVTFSNASNNPFYVRQIGVLGAKNPMEAFPYLPIGGGEVYGNILAGRDGEIDLGSSDKRFRNLHLGGDAYIDGVLRNAKFDVVNKGGSDVTVTETSETLKQEVTPDSGHRYFTYVEGVHIVANNPSGSACTLYLQARALLDDGSEVNLSDWVEVSEGSSFDDWIRWIYDAIPNGKTIKSIRLYAYASATPTSGSEPTVRIDKVVGLQV